MSFDTFPIPGEEGKVDVAYSRLRHQSALADKIDDALRQELVARLQFQDGLANTVLTRLTRSANGRLASQTKVANGIAQQLQMAAAQRIANQGAVQFSLPQVPQSAAQASPLPAAGTAPSSTFSAPLTPPPVSTAPPGPTQPNTFGAPPSPYTGSAPMAGVPYWCVVLYVTPPSGVGSIQAKVIAQGSTATQAETNAMAATPNATGALSATGPYNTYADAANVCGNPAVPPPQPSGCTAPPIPPEVFASVPQSAYSSTNFYINTQLCQYCTGNSIPGPDWALWAKSVPDYGNNNLYYQTYGTAAAKSALQGVGFVSVSCPAQFPPPPPPPVDGGTPGDTGPFEDPPNLACQLPGPPSNLTGDLCGRIATLADYLVKVGNAIQAGEADANRISDDWLRGFLAWMTIDYDVAIHAAKSITAWWMHDEPKCILDAWVQALAAVRFCDTGRVKAILAVRVTMAALADATYDGGFSETFTTSRTGEGSIGLQVFKLGGGITWSNTRALVMPSAAKVSIKPLLVPVLSLIDSVLAREAPLSIPGAADAVDSVLQGVITEETAECWAGLNGQRWEEFRRLLDTRSERLRGVEIIQWGRRLNMPEDVIDTALRSRGWYRESDRNGLKQLYDRLPSVGESLNWFAHNVDDLADVLRSGKFSGFDDVQNCFARWKELVFESGIPQPIPDSEAFALIQKWADFMAGVGQGPTFVPRFGKGLRDSGVSDAVMTQNYLANWNLPPVTQLFEMAFRLRPGRVGADVQFTDVQLKRYLAEWKFSPIWIDKLYAIARPAPNLTLITQAFQVGSISQQEYTDRLGDLGFSATDSGMLADARVRVAVRQQVSQSHGWTPAALANAFGAGQISEDEVKGEMQAQYWPDAFTDKLLARAEIDFKVRIAMRARQRTVTTTVTRILAAYEVGTINADGAAQILSGVGYGQNEIDASLAATDAAVKTATLRKALSALRRAFLDGELSLVDVQTQLNLFGVSPQRQQDYLTTWQVERSGTRRVASTAKILAWADTGLLDIPTAALRLANLGWHDPDLMLLLTEAQQKLAQRQAKAAAIQAKTDKQKATELARLQAQAARQVKQLQSQLRRTQPISRLKKWLLNGVVTEKYVRQRMFQEGYSPQNIDLYIKEWTNGQGPPLDATQEEVPPA